MDYSEVKCEIVEDRPKSGMWHCGPNACWITLTHIKTGASVRIFSDGKYLIKDRLDALMLLEVAVEVSRDDVPQFMENIQ